ncbi:MAG: phosphopyruvate hydratase [Alphaproteobacteria bacterium]
MNTSISFVRGRRVWDSRGRPTVEVDVELAGGARGRGMAPAGASRGRFEAIDLRDGGAPLGGFDVSGAVANVTGRIAPALAGMDARDQDAVDGRLTELDGTDNFAVLGGNASIATSMAVLNAAANAEGLDLWRYLADGAPVRLPLPEIQIFGGGAHAGRRVDVQDFLIMPVGAASFDEAMVMTAEVYRAAGEIMADRGALAGVADEGGWWPDFAANEDALDTLAKAIEAAGYRNGEVVISLDIAASEFGENGRYRLGLEDREFDTGTWIDRLGEWIARYPILSIEDPVGEDDPEGMRAFTKAFGDRIQIIGDDYLVTDPARVTDAIAEGACNAVLLKPNQAGTISRTRAAMETAKAAGWGMVVSARSGETEDTMIVHLATGWNTGQLKVGSFARSERMAKWNEVLRIEEALGGDAVYAGADALPEALRGGVS